MSNFDIFVFLSIGVIGIVAGIFCIYAVVFRKLGIDAINKGKVFPPFNFGPFLNRVNFVWFGIALIIFFGALTFAVIQENFLK